MPTRKETSWRNAALLLGAALAILPTCLPNSLAAQAIAAQPRSLSLEDALALAARSSENVGLARAGLTRARGQQFQARSALMPQLSTALNYQKQLQNQFEAITRRFSSGGGSDSSSGGDITDSPITRIFASPYTTTFTLQATQPIFTGGRARAGVQAARLGRTSADIGVESAMAQAKLDVTEAYYDAVLSERLVAIAESSLVQAERTARQVQLTFNVGNTSEFELIRARVSRDNQRPQYLQSRTQRDLAHLRLKQLLDLPLEQPISLTSPIQESRADVDPLAPQPTSLTVTANEVISPDPRVREAVQGLVAAADTALSDRLPVRQASLAVGVAQQQLTSVRAQRWPQLSLSTNYQRFAYPDDGLPRSLADFFPNWSVSLGATLPLFTGGRVRGEILAAEAGVQEAQLRLQQTREAAQLDLQQSIMQLEQAQSAWLASVGTAEQAQRGYDIADVRYREGISTQLELSDTRVQLQQALANRAQAARDLQVARVRLTLLHELPLSQSGAGAMGISRSQPAQQTARPTQSTGTGGSNQPGSPSGDVLQ